MKLAMGGNVCRCSQFDVQRAQQAGLAQLGRRVLWEIHVSAKPQRDQRVPGLTFDMGDVSHRDVPDPDPRILLQVGHIGKLYLDGERSGASSSGSRQWQRVQAPPAATAAHCRHRNHS